MVVMVSPEKLYFMIQVTENQFTTLLSKGQFTLEIDTEKIDFCIFHRNKCIAILYKRDLHSQWIISELEAEDMQPDVIDLYMRLKLIKLSLIA